MEYTKTVWRNSEIITTERMNKIEEELELLASNTYGLTQYDYDSATDAIPGNMNNKIATMKAVDRQIDSIVNTKVDTLDSTLNMSSGTEDSSVSESYRKVLTSITEANGVLTSLKYKEIPIASANDLGLIKVGSNLTIDANGLLAGNYQTDGTYNSSTNKLATASSVKALIGNAPIFNSVNNTNNTAYDNARLTITGITGANTGTITFTRSLISIPVSQINDIAIQGTADSSGTNSGKYVIPTCTWVTTQISNSGSGSGSNTSSADISAALAELDGNITGTAGIGKTLRSFSQTDGVITAEFDDISITKSQISDLTEVGSAPVSGTDTRVAGLLSVADKDALDAVSLTVTNLTTIGPAPASGTDERALSGLISRNDKDTLDNLNVTIDNLLDQIILDTHGYITGIKIYNDDASAYKILSFDGLSESETVE